MKLQPNLAKSDADIAACFAVMQQLRPHLVKGQFVDAVRSMEANDYRSYIKGSDSLIWLSSEGNERRNERTGTS